MKKTLKKFLTFIMAVCIVGGMTTAYAATDASAYLSGYRAICTAKSGCMIAVTVEVDGAGVMDDIGAAQIHVYRSADNKHFDFLRTFDCEDFPAIDGPQYGLVLYDAHYFPGFGWVLLLRQCGSVRRERRGIQHAYLHDKHRAGEELNLAEG